jgi:hypothetical protein
VLSRMRSKDVFILAIVALIAAAAVYFTARQPT